MWDSTPSRYPSRAARSVAVRAPGPAGLRPPRARSSRSVGPASSPAERSISKRTSGPAACRSSSPIASSFSASTTPEKRVTPSARARSVSRSSSAVSRRRRCQRSPTTIAGSPRLARDTYEPRDARAGAAACVDGHQRLVVVVVHVGQVGELPVVELTLRREEAAVARVLAELGKRGDQQRRVGRLDGPDCHARVIGPAEPPPRQRHGRKPQSHCRLPVRSAIPVAAPRSASPRSRAGRLDHRARRASGSFRWCAARPSENALHVEAAVDAPPGR